MPQHSFDLAKCSRCMLCLEVCPSHIIVKGATGAPSIIEARHADCIRCGHCEAICPEAAVTVDHPSLRPVPVVDSDGSIEPDRFLAYCMERRSIRKYRPDEPGRPVVERLLDIARYAPSGVNRHSVQWTVILGREKVKDLADAVMRWIEEADRRQLPLAARMHFGGLVQSWREGADPIFRGAPLLVVAHANAADRMAQGDATIALSHIELAAPAFGLGACWAGYFAIVAGAAPEIRARIGLAEDQAVPGTMMLGVPALRYRRPPKRAAATVTWR